MKSKRIHNSSKNSKQNFANQTASGGENLQTQGNKNIITNNHNTHDQIVNQLIESLNSQICFLQSCIEASRVREKSLHDELTLLKKTIDVTLAHLCNCCKECMEIHNKAHRKLDTLALSKDNLSKKKNRK
jgi:hypothetical protein